MLGDLKKFGLPNIKSIKVENIRSGSGEIVCQLVDELVNLELYRRDFEFISPVFPEDDDDGGQSGDEELDESALDSEFQGRNEIMNGIEIQTHSMMSPGGLINPSTKAPTTRNRNNHIIPAEETKINFYDPNKNENIQQEEEKQILETKIDPLEWKQEIDRVYRDLVNIEKEIEVLKRQGDGASGEDFEECRRHIELIIEMCNDIRQSSHHEVRKVFGSSAEKLDDDL